MAHPGSLLCCCWYAIRARRVAMRARCKRPGEAVAPIQAPVAPVRRHRFEAHRAAFEHRLQPIDAVIALPQTLGPAEAVSRTVPHAELFEAEPAAWRIVDQPELFAFWPRTSGSENRPTSRHSGTSYGRRR